MAAAAAWQARLPLANAYGPALVSEALGQPVRFEVAALTLERIDLRRLAIGEDGPEARQVEIAGALIARRIESVRIDGLTATVGLGPDGAPSVRGLTVPAPAAGGTDTPALDLGALPASLSLTALALTVETPAGPHLVEGSARWRGPAADGSSPVLDLALTDAAGGGRVELTGALEDDGVAVNGIVDLDPALFTPLTPQLEAAQGRLQATIFVALGGAPRTLEALADRARLSLEVQPQDLALTLADLGTVHFGDAPISIEGSSDRLAVNAPSTFSLTLDRPPPGLRQMLSSLVPTAAAAPIVLTPAEGAALSLSAIRIDGGVEITSNERVHIVNGPLSAAFAPKAAWRDADGLSLTLGGDASIALAPGPMAQGARLRRPLAIEVRDGAVITLPPEGPPTLDAALAIRDVALTLPDGEMLDLFLPDLRPKLTDDGLGLAFTGAAAHWPAGDLTATQMEGWVEGGLGGPYALSLTVPEVVQAGAPLLSGESALEGTAAPTTAGGWRFDGTLFNADRRIETTLQAMLPADGAPPSLVFETAPLLYSPDGLQPGALSPLVEGLFQEVTGTLALSGDAALSPDGPAGRVLISLDALGFKSGLARLEDLTGDVRVDLARAPATEPAQRLTARVAVAGLPAAAIDLTFALDERARLLIDRLAIETLGGEALVRDARYDPIENSFTGAVDLSGLSLGQALASLGVEGVEGEGRLTGSFPITVTASDEGDGPPEVTVTQGRIAAEAPGVLRIDNPAVQDYLGGRNQAVDMMVEALQDFRYDRLSADLDIRPDGQGDLKLSIFGRNPAVLQGQPFDLNITVETDFAKLFGTLAEAFSTTDALLERLARRAR